MAKNTIKNISVLCISIVVCFICGELFWRVVVFSKIPILQSLRKPDFFADYFSDDDYWKLQYIMNYKWHGTKDPHPLLGWIGDFSKDSYLHNKSQFIKDRRPVLLYGDSFASGISQEIFNNDSSFSLHNYFLNYGVGGYGLDQIYLLFKNSYYLYKKPLVIISLLPEDLDRSILSIRTGQKPYFIIRNGELVLQGIPVSKNPDEFFKKNPPGIHSYFYARITHAIPRAICPSLWDNEKSISHKELINKKLLEEIINVLRKNDIDFFFLVFHAEWKGVTSIDGADEWRDTFIKEILKEQAVEYVWVKDLYKKDNPGRKYPYEKYFIPGDGHPTFYFNKVIAEEIKHRVQNHSIVP